ncbi:hypothetical protein BIW11_02793 [Tropilaelaps mercedesae]|uniref:Ig-like domain-containing protein n=1 Tax=Tropilaelaps mercedesae TaxID=418985 RepID=A0A1V9XXJ9_9ACAR|nr:hypothetical protein BIW11_02793 [Tropilaelaps mercedesae]
MFAARHVAHQDGQPTIVLENRASSVDMNRINAVADEDDFSHFRLEGPSRAEVVPSINRTLTPANITAQLGSTAYLHCVVHNRAQKTVTWLRRSDYHILTVGLLTYTSDERFSSSARELQSGDALTFPLMSKGSPIAATTDISEWDRTERGPDRERTEDWMLQIRGVAKADGGDYECQINTRHPLVSTHINLIVLGEFG